MTRPHVLLSVAVSLDGHIDDRGTERFPLSNAEDFDHVDRMRAESDAILAGAETLRRDNARLLVYSDERRAQRIADGKPEFPLRVTVTRSGKLDPELRFCTAGRPARLLGDHPDHGGPPRGNQNLQQFLRDSG
ncbi:RibD family protein [Lentzea indica]|uniref:RibD family protein n=1 Tax=Lentzea indica TaxID=2604800 RepID=UPI0028ADBD00|nr:dihydrofolate reductase family protein [Lentzea indica]